MHLVATTTLEAVWIFYLGHKAEFCATIIIVIDVADMETILEG